MSVILSRRIAIIGGMGNEAMLDLVEKMAAIPGSEQHEFLAFGNARLAYKPQELTQAWLPTDLPECRKKDTAIFSLKFMHYLGADVMGLACNSAHELFRKLLPDLPITFVDMIHETARFLEGSKENILIMGVNSIINSGLYQSALTDQGITSAIPSSGNQKKIMDAIYDSEFGIKTAKITREAETLLCEVIQDESQRQGCSKIVLGCTELPLALAPERLEKFKEEGLIPENIEIIDASYLLARSLLRATGNRGEEISLQQLDACRTEHTDWFAPLSFQVNSLDEMASIQRKVFRHTLDFLEGKGRSLAGSYMHLPTLFISNAASDAQRKLAAMGISLYLEDENLDVLIRSALEDYYQDINTHRL